MTCLMLVGQGFAMDAWIDHKSAKAPEEVNECYQITTPAELAWFAKNVNDNKPPYCAKVMADLDMAGYHWIPISAKGTQRAVNFDGNSKIIRNLYISAEEILKKYPNDRQYAQNLGLIGAFTGHVQNVILENVEVYAYGNGYVSGNKDNEKSPLSIGTVVGWQANPNSIVENCYVTGKMVTSGDGQAVGGIVGNNGGGTIRNCYSEVNIDASGTAYVGGIAGYTKAYTSGAVATISSCVYAGNTLSSTGSGAAGAIVGNHYDGTTAFENVYYDSDIFGDNSIGRTRAGDTTGSPTGASELNSALIACTLNGGEMVDGVCTKDSPWSDAATSISLNGYGADGYKITFNANEGSFAGGTTFVKYVKAGNIINNDGVANPSWGDDSYVFAGWSGDDYNKAATKATTITASWNKMHTITFSPVNGNLHGTFPNGSSESVSIKVENGKRIAVQGFERPTTFTDAQNVKYNFMGWANGDDPTILYVENGLDNLPLATEDMTLVAAWTTAPVFTVRFYEDETSTASYVSSVYENEHATELTVDKMDPHPGYTFEGWFERDAENSFDFTQNITSDVDLFAKWTKNTYTVNYVLNCSDECTNSNANEFTVDGMPLADPEWNEKYRFLGWYADAEFKDEKTSIPSGLTENISLYAKWDTVTYDITYRAGAYGTGLVASEKKFHNEPYTLRDASYTRKGYLQSGWVSEEGLTYAFGDEYSANAPLIVYPTWDTISYTITYECNGCDVSDNKKYPKSFNVESKFSIKDPASISAEYKFGGWFKNAEFSGNKNPNVAKGTTGDFTFYGKWNKIYKITYVGTDKPYCDTLYTVDDAITLRNPADSAGYTFGGWFTNANFEGDAATGIVKGSTGDTTFYAKWVPVPYTIAYNIDGEPAELTPNTYTAASATELATPTRNGYEFDGWYSNDEYTGDKVTSIAAGSIGDTAFFAKWTPVEYSITYVLGEGASNDNDNPASYTVETDAFTLKDAVKNGYTFEGWFNGEGEKVTTVAGGATGNLELTAQFTIETYTITYHNVEGATFETPNPTSYTVKTLPIVLKNPTKEGYNFEGWFTDESFTSGPITGINTKLSEGNGDLYAKWSDPIEYAITYVGADDLENLNPTSYTVLENDLALLPVSKSGFKFLGWFNASDELVESISAGSTGDITLTAKWADFPITVATYGGVTILENEDGTRTAAIDASSMETVEIAEDVSVDNVTFDRAFTVGATSTIMLPFSIATSKVSGGKFYEFADLQKNEETGRWAASVKPPEQSELQANKPYLFIPEETSIVFNLGGEPVSLNTSVMNPSTSGNWSFKGVYEKTVFTEEHPELGKAYGFSAEDKNGIKIGQFFKAGVNAWLRPFRAYLAYNESVALAKSTRSVRASLVNGELPETIDVEIQDGTTRVIGGGTLNTRTGEIKMDRWYDMNGRRLNSKPTTRGTYYYNGKRIVVR